MRGRHMTYREIAADLAARIHRGEYGPDDRLPSYAEAATLYSVSMSTIQRSYLLLTVTGVARGESGRGIFVEPQKVPEAA